MNFDTVAHCSQCSLPMVMSNEMIMQDIYPTEQTLTEKKTFDNLFSYLASEVMTLCCCIFALVCLGHDMKAKRIFRMVALELMTTNVVDLFSSSVQQHFKNPDQIFK